MDGTLEESKKPFDWGDPEKMGPLSQETVDRLRETFESFNGPQNVGGLFVATPGSVIENGKSPGDPRYRALLDQLWGLHCRKTTDYGSQTDYLANLRASETFGIPAWVGAMIRANDKVFRIQQFAQKGTLANEGVEDSLMDLAAYSLLALILYRETSEQKEKETKK